MKYALVISALAALATAAEKPKFLNSNFQIIEGQSFDLKFDGCEGGCTITLQDGPNTNLKDYKVISTSATGGSLAWVPEGVVSGTYAFKITNNANKEYNYSQQFSFLGTGATATVTPSAASTTGSSTDSATATASSTEASSTVSITASSTESSTESRTASTTTISTVTSSATAASGSSTTSAPSSATSHSSTSTRSTTAATTTVPNAGVRATPMAFVAGAVAALAYLG
ncbi:uncharacterized protein G6M90_00g101430 [Metarhizium brunneum]|uniref:Extracellular matrix protein n=1 Tax=Metarhizium brunneum TaxID=500148 RepID=A0A7D5YXI3_9HYPO